MKTPMATILVYETYIGLIGIYLDLCITETVTATYPNMSEALQRQFVV
jgi:hypothetical protein